MFAKGMGHYQLVDTLGAGGRGKSNSPATFAKDPATTPCFHSGRLTAATSASLPTWSGDGRLLVYAEAHPKTRYDLWTLPREGDRKPVALLQTEFNESQGQLSPDDRWMTYGSDDSNLYKIHVRPFPSGAERSLTVVVNWRPKN